MNRRKLMNLILSFVLLLGVFFTISFMSSAEEEAFTPKMSITMSDSLIFNVYVPNWDGVSSIEIDGEAKDLSSLKVTDGYYHVAVPLDVCDADREINLSVTLDDGTEIKKGSFTFSIVKYAGKLLSGDESDTTKKLAKDILAYINSAKAFFGEETSEQIQDMLSGYESEFSPIAAENSAVGLKDAAFVLGAKPSVRFYIAEGYTASDFSFKRGEITLDFITGSDEKGLYIEIFSYAYAMTETITYSVNGLEGEGKYNLSSYCGYVRDEYQEDDKLLLLDLTEKFYIYCESSAAYRKEVIISMCEHEYTSSVKEKATPTKEGIMEYSCSKCTHSYEEKIPTTLKLLAIGNSFSEDSFAHMYIVAKAAGIENVVLGNLYEGGCSLDTHYKYMSGDLAEYNKFYVSSDSEGGMIVESTNATAKHAITYTDWDYISIQQASNYSGLPDKYGNLQGLIDYINANKTGDAEILWHMTWAYQQDSTHTGFANYGNDQITMYNSIVDTVNDIILTNSDITGVIPSGTAVQNLRTSVLGDTLTRDGYHLSYGIGRYTASLTWIAYLTGCDVDKITATPSDYPEVASSLDYIKDAVKKAIVNPFEITESAYPAPSEPEAPETLLNTTLSPLTDSDRTYLTENGFDPDRYMLLDFDVTLNGYYNSANSTKYAIQEIASSSTNNQYMKWWSTQIFSRSELITGSVIRLDEGYKYRPEGWIDMAKNSTRPDVVYAGEGGYCITVDDAWWGDYNYRAFNVGKDPNFFDTTSFAQDEYDAYEADASALTLKIYIPIVKRAELTDEDEAYLVSQGLNPDFYQVLDFEYYLDAFYNSPTTSISNVISGSGNVKGMYVATEIFSKYDLTVGSIIRIAEENHKYRPEGWVTLSTKNSSSARPAEVTASHVVVDSTWWGTFNYRGFNIKDTSVDYTDSQTYVTDEDAVALRIYVLKDTMSLTADDITYLKSLGVNPDEYRVLELEITHNAYYNSGTGFAQNRDGESSGNYCKYLATQVFSKTELTEGSVIRLESGYKYRPDAWVDLVTLTPKANRPATVTAASVIIDEAWWGDFNYCGFNINKTSGETIELNEGENFKIYVKIA